MLPFITDEHRMIQQAARDFAQKAIAPIAAHHDETGEFPLPTIREMGKLGFMALEVPEQYGGSEMDTLAYVLAMIEISKADASHGTIMSINNSLICGALLKYGTEAQKQTYLVPIATGEKLGAYSLTEPDSGSDAANMKSRAVLNEAGTHYVINGRKAWVTSAPHADFAILFTVTNPSQGANGISCFIVDTDQPGFSRGKTEPKMGIRASATSEILFDNYLCPVENRLGEEGQGFKMAMSLLDAGRVGIAAQALGIAEAALEASVAYSKERESMGKKIGQYQMIQQKLADMKTQVEAARLLVYQAAVAKHTADRTGERISLYTSMAKLFASETAMFVTHSAVQIHGGMGYSKELPIERYFRDAKITEIYEGTSEIQRMVIARQLTGLR